MAQDEDIIIDTAATSESGQEEIPTETQQSQ